MKLDRAENKKPEPTIPLKNTKPGDCLRFARLTFEEALKTDDFYMRVDAPEAKDRIRLVNLADGKQLERDGDHQVVVHRATLQIET